MLKKFDWYIIKKYLSTFFFTMLLITMVAICIDYFEKVDRFLNDELTFSKIVNEYYLNFIPWINGLLFPLYALIAVIFFTSRLARNTEVISILSAGISYNRFIRPYIVGGLLLSVLLWVGNNYIIPKSTRIKNEFESQYIKKNTKKTLNSNVHFFTKPGEKIYFRLYSTRDSSVRSFRLEHFDNNKLTYVFKSKRLKYKGDIGKWHVDNYEERFLKAGQERLIFHKDADLDTIFPFHPDDFVRYSKQMEMMTTSELREYIVLEQEKGLDTPERYLIELYRRTSDPFTILILTIIGVSIASRKVRGGIGLHLSIGVAIGAVYVILSKFAVTFVTNLHFSPLIGVWIPNIIFALVAFFLYRNAQK